MVFVVKSGYLILFNYYNGVNIYLCDQGNPFGGFGGGGGQAQQVNTFLS